MQPLSCCKGVTVSVESVESVESAENGAIQGMPKASAHEAAEQAFEWKNKFARLQNSGRDEVDQDTCTFGPSGFQELAALTASQLYAIFVEAFDTVALNPKS